MAVCVQSSRAANRGQCVTKYTASWCRRSHGVGERERERKREWGQSTWRKAIVGGVIVK